MIGMIGDYLLKFFSKKQKIIKIKDKYEYLKNSHLVKSDKPTHIYFIRTSDYSSIQDAIIGEQKKDRIDIEYLAMTGGNYIHLIGHRSSFYDYYDAYCPKLDIEISIMGFCRDVPVYIKDANINGRIKGIEYAIFSEYSLRSVNDNSSKLSKILIIEGVNNKTYYRLPTQVNILKGVPQLKLVKEFKESIEDYLLDVIDSKKFDVSIDPKLINDIPSFRTVIIFKDDINIKSAAYIFNNINLLKERLCLIDKCDVDIEDLTKRGIILKIYKFPIVN